MSCGLWSKASLTWFQPSGLKVWPMSSFVLWSISGWCHLIRNSLLTARFVKTWISRSCSSVLSFTFVDICCARAPLIFLSRLSNLEFPSQLLSLYPDRCRLWRFLYASPVRSSILVVFIFPFLWLIMIPAFLLSFLKLSMFSPPKRGTRGDTFDIFKETCCWIAISQKL